MKRQTWTRFTQFGYNREPKPVPEPVPEPVPPPQPAPEPRAEVPADEQVHEACQVLATMPQFRVVMGALIQHYEQEVLQIAKPAAGGGFDAKAMRIKVETLAMVSEIERWVLGQAQNVALDRQHKRRKAAMNIDTEIQGD